MSYPPGPPDDGDTTPENPYPSQGDPQGQPGPEGQPGRSEEQSGSGWTYPPESSQPGGEQSGEQYGQYGQGYDQQYGQQYGQPQDQGYGQQGQQGQYGYGQGYGQYGQGYGQQYDPAGYGQQSPTTNGKATASLITGISTLVLSWCCGLGLLGLVAVFLGVKARSEITASNGRQSGDGMALGGIITGAIAAVFGLLFLVFIIWAIASGNTEYNVGPNDDPFGNGGDF